MYLFGGKFCMYGNGTRECNCKEIVTKHPLCVCDRKHFNNVLWATVTVFQVGHKILWSYWTNAIYHLEITLHRNQRVTIQIKNSIYIYWQHNSSMRTHYWDTNDRFLHLFSSYSNKHFIALIRFNLQYCVYLYLPCRTQHTEKL